jgi:hypothetical protein
MRQSIERFCLLPADESKVRLIQDSDSQILQITNNQIKLNKN